MLAGVIAAVHNPIRPYDYLAIAATPSCVCPLLLLSLLLASAHALPEIPYEQIGMTDSLKRSERKAVRVPTLEVVGRDR